MLLIFTLGIFDYSAAKLSYKSAAWTIFFCEKSRNIIWKVMADKLNEFVNQFNKGGQGAPKGLGLGVKLLAAAGAAFYGLQQSVYTGK